MTALSADAFPHAPPARSRSIRALGAVNFFLADVRDGLGPFLGVFLIGQGWSTATVGTVMTIGGIAGMLATTPLGALADASRAKRFMVGSCAALVIVASLAILFAPSFPMVAASQIATGIAGAAIGPALAGLTLGLVGQSGLARQLGRNEAWNHGGNVFAAAAAGVLGYQWGLPAVFALMTVLAAFSIGAVLLIRPKDVDHDAARGLERKAGSEGGEVPSGFGVLWRSAPLLILAATLMLFHLGNGAMLPLLGQQVAAEASGEGTATDAPAVANAAPAGATAGRPAAEPVTFGGEVPRILADPTSFTAATVIVAQLTMVPMALLAAAFARRRGYFLLLVAALVALPLRGAIAGLWPSDFAFVPVQILDGIGGGLLGVAVPGLVARILKGTGHVNAGLGAVMTVQGIGASLSPAIGGYIAARFGFSAAYLSLGAFAFAGLALWVAMASRTAAACAGTEGKTAA